jgi:hypothetical protein
MKRCLTIAAYLLATLILAPTLEANEDTFRLRIRAVDQKNQIVSAAAGEGEGHQVVQLRIKDPALLARLKAGDEVDVNLADKTVSMVVKVPLETVGDAGGKEADAIARARDEAKGLMCGTNLRQLGLGLVMYANDHKGRFPANLGQLAEGEYVAQPAVFLCPAAGRAVAKDYDKLPPDQKAKWIVENTSYGYNGAGKKASAPADTVLAFELAGNHGLPLVKAVFMDGHLETVTPERWDKLLANDAGLKAVVDAMRSAKAKPAGTPK